MVRWVLRLWSDGPVQSQRHCQRKKQTACKQHSTDSSARAGRGEQEAQATKWRPLDAQRLCYMSINMVSRKVCWWCSVSRRPRAMCRAAGAETRSRCVFEKCPRYLVAVKANAKHEINKTDFRVYDCCVLTGAPGPWASLRSTTH